MRGSTLIATDSRDRFYPIKFSYTQSGFAFPYPFIFLTAKGKLSEKPYRRYLSLRVLLYPFCFCLSTFFQIFFNKIPLFRRNIFLRTVLFPFPLPQNNRSVPLRQAKLPRSPTLPPLKRYGSTDGILRCIPFRFL